MATMNINGTELAVELSTVSTSGYVHTHNIVVRHPAGCEATFEICDYRGLTVGRSTECPAVVCEAVRALVARMDAAWAAQLVGERFDIKAVFEAALVAQS